MDNLDIFVSQPEPESSEANPVRKRRNFLSDQEASPQAGIRVKQEVSELVEVIGFEPDAMIVMINVHRAKSH